MQQQTTIKLKVTDINEHLLCVLCAGYLVDATTIIECLHSFCRSCIVKHLEAHKTCPRCDVMIHKTKPLLNLRPDKTLQTLVYKLVPGVFQNEKQKRRQFYASRPEAVPTSGADSGDIEESHLMYTEDEKISLCLQHCHRLPSLKYATGSRGVIKSSEEQKDKDTRYLLCPALVTIACLKKFLQQKFDLQSQFQVEIFHSDETLNNACTLMDVANIYCWKRTKPLNLHYIVFDKTQLSLELPDPTDASIGTATQKLTRKRSIKRTASGKSPNGLVKSRSFKPPKPRERKNPKKKAGAKCEAGKAQGNVNNVAMTNNGKHEIGDNTRVVKDTVSNKNVVDIRVANSKKDIVVEIADSEYQKIDKNGKMDIVSEQLSQSDHGAGGKTNQNIESMDTDVDLLNTSGEQDRFGVVMDTVADEDTLSVLEMSHKRNTSDEDNSVKPNTKSVASSEDEQPLSVVKIKLKSPPSDKVTDPAKSKRAGKTNKSKLSTRKSKSPITERKRSKKVKEYEIVMDCNDNGPDDKALEAIRNRNSVDSSKVEGKPALVDLTQHEGTVESTECEDAVDNDNQEGIMTKDIEPEAVGGAVVESQTEDKTNGVVIGEIVDNAKSQSSSEEEGKMEVSASVSPDHTGESPEAQLSPEKKVTEINDYSPQCKSPQTVIDGKDKCKDNQDSEVSHMDTSESDRTMNLSDKDHQEKKNNLMNQPDLVRSSVPVVECQCSKSSISSTWSDQRGGQCGESCGKHMGSDAGDMVVDRASPVSEANSPPSQVTESGSESLLSGMNSRDVNKQWLSPASSICSVSSSLPGQSDITMEDNLSSPGSQTSTVDSSTSALPIRNRKTSTRDKAKSINSIIKQIEERKSKMGDTCVKTPQRSGHTPEPNVAQVTSPVTPTAVNSHVAGNYAPNQSLRYSSPSPSNDLAPVHVPKAQAKRRNVSPAHTSPDATPMKRLKQLCNVFGEDGELESSVNRRNNVNRPPSTGASISPQMYYPQYAPRAPVRMGMDQRAMMQAVQMGQLHQLQQAAQHKQAAQQHAQQQKQQKQHKQLQQQLQQQQRNHLNAAPRQKPRNHCVSGVSVLSPRDGRPAVMKPFGNKKPELPPACPTIMHPQSRPVDASVNSAALMNANKMARPSTPLRPAHTGPNPYYMDYSSHNPRANGYDEPLELTTKKSRDRKAEDLHPKSPGTFLKIPNLLKP